jgi:hypothetical protein
VISRAEAAIFSHWAQQKGQGPATEASRGCSPSWWVAAEHKPPLQLFLVGREDLGGGATFLTEPLLVGEPLEAEHLPKLFGQSLGDFGQVRLDTEHDPFRLPPLWYATFRAQGV